MPLVTEWLISARWGGNLQDIPLAGTVHDYKQVEPGLCLVAIRCTPAEAPVQVALLASGDRCSRIMIEPYFEQLQPIGLGHLV